MKHINNLHIDYGLIDKALKFYQAKGYELFDAQWLVAPQYSNVTLPHEGGAFRTFRADGFAAHLVGSAEQSFIEQVANQKMKPHTKYVSVSPCFRRGDTQSTAHRETFMKVELSGYATEKPSAMYTEFLEDAWYFFKHELGISNTDKLKVFYPTGGPGPDIMYEYENGTDFPYLELGSYGTRKVNLKDPVDLQFKEHVIHYGTGLALPRTQLILD